MTPESFDLDLPSGRIHGERRGPQDGRTVLCVHGLSANLRAFDAIAARLPSDVQVVAFDLRGRGRSEITPRGTYGLDAHAADVLAVADQLGVGSFSLLGWSMGALIGIRLAATSADRMERLVLVDHAGDMDEQALEAIKAGLARLDAVTDTPEEYVGAIRAIGAATPWGPFWEAFYRYELAQREDGRWSPSTDRQACTEDVEQTVGDDFVARWSALRHVPTLLVRATVDLRGGLIVPETTLRALLAAVPDVRHVDVDRNHFGIMDAPETLSAVTAFLRP